MRSPILKPGLNFADVVILGNGSAAAGAVARFAENLRRRPDSNLQVMVLDADTEQQRAARMPEYNARVTFPADLPLASADPAVLTWYEHVAFHAPRTTVRKPLPKRQVALVDVDRLIDLLEADLPPGITVRRHKQVFDAEYISTPSGELVKLSVQFPFGPQKVFEVTDHVYARAVIDAAGTGSLMLDRAQGYRSDSTVVCGVLGFKVLGARLANPLEVSLGLDDQVTHGAGSWVYPNHALSPQLRDHLDAWFDSTGNERVRRLIAGRAAADFTGTIADVGISSIAPYARSQHYRTSLERQAEELVQDLPAYKEMLSGSAVIPGSAFFKPSPVLQPVARMAGRRYLLAGDAAGHATPYIGEGVRPGADMGHAAAGILLDALAQDDLSERRLRRPYEDYWMERYGRYDLWSDLFRHFSSTCFGDREWDTFMGRVERLTPAEFYAMLRSEYTPTIVRKMFPGKLIPHYVANQARRMTDFAARRLTVRQATSWVR